MQILLIPCTKGTLPWQHFFAFVQHVRKKCPPECNGIVFKILGKHVEIFGLPTTVCKTVRPVLADGCLSVLFVCLVRLSVTFMYCGQMVGWIKVNLGTQVGVAPGHIVLDGVPAALRQRGTDPPIFGPYLFWPNGWMDQDATW